VITINLLQDLCPTTSYQTLTKYVEPLSDGMNKYKITTPVRVAHFLSQCAHESGNFEFTIENLNYSQAGLLSTFPKYFTQAQAQEYARKPDKIGNRVYANRMGNGTESSGDGYKYRGRGLIQLTGKNNYTKLSESIGKSIDDTILYLNSPIGATVAALWFWDVNKLVTLSDTATVDAITRKVNGGLHGYTDRLDKYKRILSYIDKNKGIP